MAYNLLASWLARYCCCDCWSVLLCGKNLRPNLSFILSLEWIRAQTVRSELPANATQKRKHTHTHRRKQQPAPTPQSRSQSQSQSQSGKPLLTLTLSALGAPNVMWPNRPFAPLRLTSLRASRLALWAAGWQPSQGYAPPRACKLRRSVRGWVSDGPGTASHSLLEAATAEQQGDSANLVTLSLAPHLALALTPALLITSALQIQYSQ